MRSSCFEISPWQNGLDDLLTGLSRDGLAAVRAMRNANGGIDHAEVIVNFRDGSNRGTRRARSGLLLDGNRWRKPSMTSTSGRSI